MSGKKNKKRTGPKGKKYRIRKKQACRKAPRKGDWKPPGKKELERLRKLWDHVT